MAKSFSVALLLCIVAGCSGNSEPVATPAPAGSTVSIIGISPSTDSPLRVGQKVRLEVRVAYNLVADSGTLSLVVQDSSNSMSSISRINVPKGNGNQEFVSEFVVPEAKEIQVFVPLGAANQGATTTLDTRAFKVALQ